MQLIMDFSLNQPYVSNITYVERLSVSQIRLVCLKNGQELWSRWKENIMKVYPIPMVPGPVKVAQEALDADQMNYGSADLESEFIELYNHTETNLKIIMSTKNEVVIQT